MSSLSITGSNNEILNKSLNFFSEEIMNFSPDKLYLISQLFLVKVNYYTDGLFSSWTGICLPIVVGTGIYAAGIYYNIKNSSCIVAASICGLVSAVAFGMKVYNGVNKASYQRMYNHTKHVMTLKELTPFGDIKIPLVHPKQVLELAKKIK